MQVTAANTYTGTTTINGGILQIQSAETPGSSGPLGNNGTIVFGGGTLQFTSANNFDYSSRIDTSAQPISIDTNGQTVTFGANLMSGVAGSLTLQDTAATKGALFISGFSTYSGLTTVLGGDLRGIGTLQSSTVVTSSGSTRVGMAGHLHYSRFGLDRRRNSHGRRLGFDGWRQLKIALNTSDPASSTQQLFVNGNTILTGGILSLGIPNDASIGNTYTIITSGNPVTGSFATIKLNGNTVVNGGGQVTVVVDNTTIPATVKLTITGAVTPVTVANFAAKAEGTGTLISWTCVSEFPKCGI